MLEKFKNIKKNELFVYAVFILFPKYIKKQYYLIKYIAKAFLYNINIGNNNIIYGNVFFSKFPNSTLKIGNNFNTVNDYFISAFNFTSRVRFKTFLPTAEIIIGNNVHINSASILCNSTKVIIGDNVLIAPNCILSDSDFHGLEPSKRSTRNPELDKPIIIENNVWISMNCIILKGTRIGENSVIAAGSIVITDVKPNSLYAGNPAKFIKKIDNDM
jgi:acetyltransferase-like isoleucine patch superfamily enzyme